ncbi:carbohydrate-binding module family 5 protein, partial [Peniophora sp. CONT]
TYYNQFGGYGACGNINPDSAIIIALQAARYDASLCGKTLSITNVNKGITIQAVVADMCPGCRNSESLDLSIGAWEAIGQSTEDGTGVPITWSLLGAAPVTTTAAPVTTTKATTTTTKASTTTVSAPATTTTASSSTCSGVAAWVSNVAYVAGDEVTYGGSLWQAKWWTEAGTLL